MLNKDITIEKFMGGLTIVGEIIYGCSSPKTTKYCEYDNPLELKWDETFPNEKKRKEYSMCYLIVVGGEILKIGRSSAKGGISSMMSFYLNAGFDESGPNRFTINKLIRDELSKNIPVKLYVILDEPKIDIWETPWGDFEIIQKRDDQVMEKFVIDIYKKLFNRLPEWNFQERGDKIPNKIREQYANYKLKRSNKKNGVLN